MPNVFIETEQDDTSVVHHAATHLDPERLHELAQLAADLKAEQEAGK